MRFATRMMCVTNEPVVNVQYDPVALNKKYEREIKELKQELAMQDVLNSRPRLQYEAFTEQQRYELQKTVKRYLDLEIDEIEPVRAGLAVP